MRTVLLILQNLIFWPLFLSATVLFIISAGLVIVVASPFESQRRTLWRLRRAISWYGKVMIYCAWPFIRVRYRDLSSEEAGGPVILVCNHRSTVDPFLLSCVPIEGVQIAKAWPLRLPVLGVLAKLAGYLSVNELTLSEFYLRAGRLLDDGVCLGAFPEGTRSGSRRMGQFNSAVFRLARQKRVPLVPLAISGAERVLSKGSLVLRPALIRVDKLSSVKWSEYRNMTAFKLKSKVREQLRRHLAELEGG